MNDKVKLEHEIDDSWLIGVLGNTICRAKEQEQNGKPGYIQIFPDGKTVWTPQSLFEDCVCPLNAAEIQLVRFTGKELDVMLISDAGADPYDNLPSG